MLIFFQSKHWVVKRYYLLYEIPNIYDENGKEILGAKSTWLEIINFMINDFSWLLRLPFFKYERQNKFKLIVIYNYSGFIVLNNF